VDLGLVRRLAWLTGLRLAFLTLLLAATAFFYLGEHYGDLSRSLWIVLASIGTAYALAAVYGAILRSRKHLVPLAYAQIVLDQATWSAIVYVSGGATSGATSFYALTCVLGAILVGVRGAAVGAVSGLGFYLFLCVSLHYGIVVPPPDQPASVYALTWEQLRYPLLVNGLGVVAVALLAGYLADRLRITGGALEEATARAREAERLAELGRISSWLAHEIRNPLGSISGSIDMLRESEALSQEDRQLCDIVRREVKRLNALVGDMLDLAKPRVPEPATCDVSALAKEVVALARRSADPEAGASVIDFEGGDTEALAHCDGAQIRQVVWNLVRNAIQASPPGGKVVVTVAASATSDGPAVELTVGDTGPGIGEDARRRIFDAFYTTRSHGAGIGLAVVKRIVDDHAAFGASISVENLPKCGAVFRVRLGAPLAGAVERSHEAVALPTPTDSP
jgi:two-component system sensor histidine kinase HydH